VALGDTSKHTVDQFCEKVIKLRLEYQNLENRLTPHATPNKVKEVERERTPKDDAEDKRQSVSANNTPTKK
jgi:hypothetical protein